MNKIKCRHFSTFTFFLGQQARYPGSEAEYFWNNKCGSRIQNAGHIQTRFKRNGGSTGERAERTGFEAFSKGKREKMITEVLQRMGRRIGNFLFNSRW
ncbi:hypothetical protein SUGI_1077920 [Cryptomeria japonica]|nr:hypothetical protein SUGI_1077920 [Cryptomeria japonica]